MEFMRKKARFARESGNRLKPYVFSMVLLNFCEKSALRARIRNALKTYVFSTGLLNSCEKSAWGMISTLIRIIANIPTDVTGLEPETDRAQITSPTGTGRNHGVDAT